MIAGAIAAVRHDGRSRSMRCPAHDDRRASLSVSAGEAGRVLLYCHAGCATADVLTAAGLTMDDLRSDETRSGPANGPQIIAAYDYTDETGVLLYQVCRFAPKDFRQRRPDGSGGWIWRLDDVRRVLFGRPALQNQQIAHVAEGEKDVKRMFTLAIQAGKLLHKPHIPLLRENNTRAGFFEPEQCASVRAHLAAPLQAVVEFAYITG